MNNIIKIDALNLEDIKYLSVQDIHDKYIKIRYNLNEQIIPLTLQTQYFYIPNGICINKYNKLSFLDILIDSNNMDSILFKNKLNELDTKIINDSFLNKNVWFNNIDNYNIDDITKLYRKQINYNIINNDNSNNFEFLRVYLPDNGNIWDFKIYDENKNIIDNLNINNTYLQDTYCRFIIICDGVWIDSDNTFGLSWRVAQIQIKNTEDDAFLFND